MPGSNGFWGGIRNGLFEGVDRLFLNNRGFNYSTGTWDGRGAATGGIQSGLNNALPGLGYLFGKGADYYQNNYNYGQAQPGDYANNAPADSSGLAGMYTGAGSLNYGGFGGNATNYGDYSPQTGGAGQIGSIQREQFPMNTQTQQPGNPYGGSYIPTMPQVTAQGQGGWQGLGTSTGNVFSGGQLGSWANGSNVQNNTAAALAGGSRGSAVQGNQWTGISGDAARSYFGGMSTASTDAAQYEAMMEMAKQQQ